MGATGQSFEGVVLGSPIKDAIATLPKAMVSNVGPIAVVRWRRADGGKLTIYGDFQGDVDYVAFETDSQARGSLLVPCAGNVVLRITANALASAMSRSSACRRVDADAFTYDISDGSTDVSGGSTLVISMAPGHDAITNVSWASLKIPTTWKSTATASPGECKSVGREAGVLNRAPLGITAADLRRQPATQAGMEVEILLGPDGDVKRAWMYRSSGSDLADDAAIAAVQNSVYRPKMYRCTPTYGVYRFSFATPQ
jgi:hypothetical protein